MKIQAPAGLALVLLVSTAPAQAGTQKRYPVEIESIGLGNTSRVSLTFRGRLLDGSIFNGSVTDAGVIGRISRELSCARHECLASFQLKGSELRVLVERDADQDGNPEARMTMKAGIVKPSGEIKLLPELEADLLLVKDRYTLPEKMAGARDRDYLSLSLTVR